MLELLKYDEEKHTLYIEVYAEVEMLNTPGSTPGGYLREVQDFDELDDLKAADCHLGFVRLEWPVPANLHDISLKEQREQLVRYKAAVIRQEEKIQSFLALPSPVMDVREVEGEDSPPVDINEVDDIMFKDEPLEDDIPF